MEPIRFLSDGLRVKAHGRSRLDEAALRALELFDVVLRLTERFTKKDREIVAALLRTGAVTPAAGEGSRSYVSRRTHQVLVPAAEILAELGRLYCDGALDRFLAQGAPEDSETA